MGNGRLKTERKTKTENEKRRDCTTAHNHGTPTNRAVSSKTTEFPAYHRPSGHGAMMVTFTCPPQQTVTFGQTRLAQA